ncbi:MAG TPA: FG-GAP-like repeat-containing protein, partial [Planctomycetaceae bacterium]|nr:FG-GAP-like repeat-containing protein [Planctomycetaceae bacterium]
MNNLQAGWVSLWRKWTSWRRPVRRGARVTPRLEPLEARTLLAGEFTDVGTAGLAGAKFSSMAWGDYDNDGDLDALTSGLQDGVGGVTKVYQNDGNGAFTDINAGLTGVYGGKATWGDYDRDGKLDILAVGLGTAKVYHNAGNGTFTDINAGLTGVSIASGAFGDYDNDGDLDILMSGRATNSAIVTKLYRNDGSSTFAEQNVGLTGVYASTVAWGDYDADGRLDILVSGLDSASSRATKIYHNEGNGTFAAINANLPGVSTSAVAWGDYDNDGDLDLALAGHDGSARISRIYRNDGFGSFTDIVAGLDGVSYASVAWGDADNDGDLDLLLTGTGFAGAVSKVYRNDGSNTFVDSNAGLTPMDRGLAAWGDSDGDRDLDILQVGRVGGLSSVKAYRNNAVTANTAPAAPTGLTAAASSPTSLTFSWTAAVDLKTLSEGLSYNLRIGTTPGGSDVVSTMADATNGLRRVAGAGPIQRTNFTLQNVTPGATYYWSVQAIDPTFSGSAFAAEQTASTNTSPTIGGAVANQPVADNSTLAPFATMTIVDPDNQNLLAKVTILNGGVRGDFTPATTAGWTRTTAGNDIIYSRYYSPAPNIGATVQAAIRAFVFQPRMNAIKPNTTELTDFVVFINDGFASATNST